MSWKAETLPVFGFWTKPAAHSSWTTIQYVVFSSGLSLHQDKYGGELFSLKMIEFSIHWNHCTYWKHLKLLTQQTIGTILSSIRVWFVADRELGQACLVDVALFLTHMQHYLNVVLLSVPSQTCVFYHLSDELDTRWSQTCSLYQAIQKAEAVKIPQQQQLEKGTLT